MEKQQKKESGFPIKTFRGLLYCHGASIGRILLLCGLFFLPGCVDDEPGPQDLFKANNPPIADAGADQNVGNGGLISLDGSNSSDPDGDVIEFQWRILDSPPGSTTQLSDPESPTPTFIGDVDGVYRIELVVVEEAEVDIQNTDNTDTGSIPTVAQGLSSEPDEVTVLVGPPGAFEGSGNKFIMDGKHFGRSAISMGIGGSMELSAEGWFFITSLPNPAADAYLMGKQGVFDVVVGTDFLVKGRLYPSSGTPVTATSNNPLTLGAWHHIALLIDRTNNQAYIALDGTVSSIVTPPAALAQNISRFTVGSPDGKNLWVGMADEVRVTQDLRYAASDFNPPKELLLPDSPFIEGARNTVHGLYHFDEPAGAFLFNDFSLRGNDLFRIALTGFQPFGRLINPRKFHTATDGGLSGSEAIIVWDTDEAATSQVNYGETTAYAETPVIDATLVTRHIVRLSGLNPSTTYHYQVRSVDASGNADLSGDFTFNTSDLSSPVLSGVGVSGSPGSTNATIIWTSDEPATSFVEYGLTSSYGSVSKVNSTPVTSHSVILGGLTLDTTYNYRVFSTDPSGNVSFSENFNFTTDASVDAAAPAVSLISSRLVNTTTAVITWTTDEPATSLVEYGTSPSYGLSSPLNSDFKTSHSVTLTGLTGSTAYNFRVISEDASGNSTSSADNTFTMPTSDAVPPVFSGINAFNDNRIWIAGGVNSAGNGIIETEMIGIDGELSLDRLLSVSMISSVIKENAGTGDGVKSVFSFTLNSNDIQRNSMQITAGSVVAVDDGNGVLSGSGVVSGSIDYDTGVGSISYAAAPADGIALQVDYDFLAGNSGLLNHTATRLRDGRILVTGGEDDRRKPRNEIFLMTPGISTLSPLSIKLATPRRFHTATVMADGRVQIALGESLTTENKTKALNVIEVLEPDASLPDTFRFGTPVIHSVEAKLHKTIIPKSCDPALVSESLLVVGGFNDLNSPSMGDPPLRTGRVRHTVACLPDGRILVTGGIDDTGTVLDTVEVYDPDSNTYTLLSARMNVPRADHSATLMANQKILISGGYNQVGQALSSAEIYDPAQNRFTITETRMSQGRFGHLALSWTDLSTGNKGVLIIGGADNDGTPIPLLEIYFP